MRKLFVVIAILLFGVSAIGQNINKGGVLIVHEWITSLDDATLKEMMDEWTEIWTPFFKKHLPDGELYWIRGIGRDNKNTVAEFLYYPSLEKYREYYNEDGTQTEKGMSVMEEAWPQLQKLMEKYGEVEFVARDWLIL